METKILQELGLTANEIKVYLNLLKVDSALASEIAKIVNLQRTNVYDLLKSLIKRGLISYIIKNGKRYFRASSPERLLEIVKEEKREITEKEEQIKQLILELEKQRGKLKEKINVEVFEGKEGLKTVVEDLLKRARKEYVSFGWTGVTTKALKFYTIYLHKRRIKLGIKRRLILDETLRKHKTIKQPLTEARFLPKGFHLPTAIIVYGNKIINVIVINSEITSIMIENKELSKMYKKYFELLWEIAKR